MPTTAAWTYDDLAVREDLLDLMTNIDPTETQLMTGLQSSTAEAPLHQWPVDILDTPGTNSATEGADAGTASITNPTRGTNWCQIVTKPYIVSGSELEANHAGFADRKSYEIDKKMKALKNDYEFALMRGTVATGSGSGARTMNGVKASITTLATNPSGVSLSETMLNAYLGNAWEQGGKVNAIYVGRVLKQRISGFTAGNTKNVDANDKRLINSVNVYESDFGAPMIKIFLHRYVTTSGDTNYDIVGLDESTWATAWFRKPFNKDLAPTGDAEKGMLIAEGTLEARAEKGNFKTTRVL